MLKKHFYSRGDVHLPDNPSLRARGVNIYSIDCCVKYSSTVITSCHRREVIFAHQGKHRLLVLIENMPLAP
jgi:hypothetical protein